MGYEMLTFGDLRLIGSHIVSCFARTVPYSLSSLGIVPQTVTAITSSYVFLAVGVILDASY